MSINEQLAPCPFCGSATAPVLFGGGLEDPCRDVTVVCDAHAGGCGAASGWDRDHDKAVADWNRRAQPAPDEQAAGQQVPYFNRRAVEAAIHAAENPPPGTMHLNDGKETFRLPGGTLRRMLSIIDALAAAPHPPAQREEQAEAVAWRYRFFSGGGWHLSHVQPTNLQVSVVEALYATPQQAAGPAAQWCANCGEGTMQGLCRAKPADPNCKFATPQPQRGAVEGLVPLSDEALAKAARQGFDNYWHEDCKGDELEAWAGAAKAVLELAGIRPAGSEGASNG